MERLFFNLALSFLIFGSIQIVTYAQEPENEERPVYVNSITVDSDGNVYTFARFEHNGKTIEDLIKIPDLFSEE